MATLTTPPVVTGTSLAVLAPYLPYGIPVRDIDNAGPFGGDTHILLGLDTQAEFPVLVGAGGESSDIAYAYHGVLPVLRPFSQLCDPLPDGTVPAVEVAKMQDRLRRNIFKAEPHPCGDASMFRLWERTANGTQQVCENIHAVSFWRELTARAADYLRSQHFAVGLEPHQFVAK